ncbi:PAN domain-containing protein At5g03700 [Impatiens glandulifera]|uniref:PAN domain-containing protein At5g03700 n=1 Tax=Impatiens glandulifera TaxID=253017 RepID=UPI001FB093BF|nr:PAN domain-containing protein At5g03700 [Impatiens glandulifera]
MGRLLYFTLSLILSISNFRRTSAAVDDNTLKIGFTAVPDSSISNFQSLLIDSTGNYSLGFLRLDRTQLNLALIHLPSSLTIWTAIKTTNLKWSKTTKLFFNGSLVIQDTTSGVSWSTDTNGDRVWITNNSNLIVDKREENSILWQSFDFPSDTLMENQIFTSTMKLVSSNGLYSMKLGSDYFGLYSAAGGGAGQIYFKHGALQAKADIIEGKPIYIVISPDGYMGMYQNGSNTPVDVEPFSSFQQNGSGLHRIRLEQDGNLKGYYWIGSSWVLDYKSISDPCELPSSCGSYSICEEGKGCSCIDNRTEYRSSSGGCTSPGNDLHGDFCGTGADAGILRREGVELPRKELMAAEKMNSQSQCENACERNCSCWGAVYSNSSGLCYRIEYPIQTLLAISDKTKTGYFKIREGAREMGVVPMGLKVGIGLLSGVIVLLAIGIGFGFYGIWKNKREGVIGYGEEHGAPSVGGPYKNLAAASFRSIELSER